MDTIYDLVVIGGGINGVGIAADAQGRGLSVLLCEQNDLASATSSASSKLIHGGLRYLEQYDFSLVRESLREREILLKSAPHLIHPLRFIIPFNKEGRSFALIRIGLFLYDFLAFSSQFMRSKVIRFNDHELINPLKPNINKGIAYSDATVDDARLVITTAKRAEQLGCRILNYTKCIAAKRENDDWELTLQDGFSGKESVIKAKALVNATGPWVDKINDEILHIPSQYHLRLVKGSHIVVPNIGESDHGFLLQHKDGRVVFVIPYCQKFTMIGTTDVEFTGDPRDVKIEQSEIDYLCDIVNHYFRNSISSAQIIYAWSGVRALVNDNAYNLSTITREYKLELNVSDQKHLPLINVFGGKLTSHRILSEKAVNLLAPFFPKCKKPWTANHLLPGGELPNQKLSTFVEKIRRNYPWLPLTLIDRYAQSYGELTTTLLKETKSIEDMGQHFGHDLYQIEINYLIEHEWAQTVEDILWRRSKLGLFLTKAEQHNVEVCMKSKNKELTKHSLSGHL